MSISRRELLTGACAAGAAGLLAGCSEKRVSGPEMAAADAGQKSGPFTFVHLTDQHVTNRRHGEDGYRKCIASINALRPQPEFVLMGGDMIWDGCYTALEDYENQIRIFKRVNSELKMPWYPCMGNHEPLGGGPREKVPPTHPGYGKKMIMEQLDWKRSYYSFDHKGWHFAVLDSTHMTPGDNGSLHQEPRIGKEQLEWLGYDLGSAGDRPKIAVVHVAAFCNMGQISGNPKHLAMDGSMVVWDTVELRKVLERHNVKCLLQGHSHRVEDTYWNGVWYITSAGGGGAWWAGSWTGSEPGYTVLRCDGDKVTWSHESFQWTPQLDAKDDLERRKIAEQKADREEQQRLLELERAGRKGA
jgi:3',5'-cyclic-AMP phosphodiesterase